MPFLGQDWRSPGQSWVKTEEGWKKTSADDKNNNVSVERLVNKRVRTNVAVSITTDLTLRNSEVRHHRNRDVDNLKGSPKTAL